MEDELVVSPMVEGISALLAMVASGRPLPAVLDAMCGLVEAAVSNCTCSVLLIEPDGRFRLGAGPTLPPGFARIVDGARVAVESGPCGAAASLKEQVIVPDLAAETRWLGLEWRTLALEHGLTSACSTPIL